MVPNAVPALVCVWILFFYMMTMIALFANFFVQSYLSGRGKAAKDRANKTKKAE